MDLDSVADELYGLPLEEFTAARTARENEAKAEGDRELVRQIHALRKPTIVAWLANRLVRERSDEVGPLLDVGRELREASAVLSGEELRRLSRSEQQLVHALVQQARRIAAASGHRVTEDQARGLEETLRAALADESLADEFAAGRLTDALLHPGFPLAPGDARPKRKKSATTTSAVHRARSDEVEGAERDVAAALSAVSAAAAARDATQGRLDEASAHAAQFAERVRRLQEEVTQALDELKDAGEQERTVRAARDAADEALREVQERLRGAEQRRTQLSL